MAASPAVDPFTRLPDELLLAVCQLLPPPATAAVAQTNKRFHGIVADALHWRRRCLETWRYWASDHDLPALTAAPPLCVAWRALHKTRCETDERAQALFETLVATLRGRLHRIEEVAAFAYDAKDLLLRAHDATPDDAEDALARRFFADAVLGRIHRAEAINIWTRLQRDGNRVPLEQALGAYDLFLLSARHGDLADISRELDRLAQAVKGANVYIWASRSTRQKAVAVAEYLRARRLVGNPDSDEYHNLRNSFLSLALFRAPHTSLPLQSVAIYCAVAQRLGVDAQPSNYPQHVHAVVRAPAGLTLDGEAATAKTAAAAAAAAQPERVMYMDPWNTADEVPAARLDDTLRLMGVPPHQIPGLMAETSTLEIARRTGRNIMHSVQLAVGRRAPPPSQRSAGAAPPAAAEVDYEAAIYAFMWKMMLLGDAAAGFSGEALARGREVGPSLLQQMQVHFPEDLGLVERTLLPLSSGSDSSPSEDHANATNHDDAEEPLTSMAQALARIRAKDLAPILPRPRDEQTRTAVRYHVGDTLVHAQYGYQGFVTGWDPRCTMPDEWIETMRVDELPRGRDQPFYHVV